MRKLEFTTLLRRVAEGLARRAACGYDALDHAAAQEEGRLRSSVAARAARRVVAPRPSGEPVKGAASSPAQLAVERAGKLEAIAFDRSNYETVTGASRLADLLEAARYQGHFAFRVKLTSSDAMRGEFVGVALALQPGHAAYVPLAHRASRRDSISPATRSAQIPMRQALGPAEADPRRRERPQDRAERQVRHGGARPLRHRARDDRRSLSHLLRAGRRPRRASARPPRRQSARPYLPHRERSDRNRPRSVEIRPRGLAARHRICRRGDRYRRSGSGSCSSRGLPPSW